MSTQSVIYCNFCISLLWFLQVVLDAVIYIYKYRGPGFVKKEILICSFVFST